MFFCIHALLYFLPTIVAANRGHKVPGILMLNILLGWTIVGWFVLLLWAMLSRPGVRLYRYAGYTNGDWR